MTLCDTGPIVALLNEADRYGTLCAQLLPSLSAPLVTTQARFTEAMHLVGRKSGNAGIFTLWKMMRDDILTVEAANAEAMRRAEGFTRQYADVPCDYADAAVLVLAEQINARRVFTIDAHFHAYQITGGKFLQVVPIIPRA